jgi:hypothetical protein
MESQRASQWLVARLDAEGVHLRRCRALTASSPVLESWHLLTVEERVAWSTGDGE